MSGDQNDVSDIQDLGSGEVVEALLKYTVSQNDIEVYEKKYRKQVECNTVELDTKFRYAWCLVNSSPVDVQKAVPILKEVFAEGDNKTKRDTLFYLAMAHTKLREYLVAKKHIKSFLSIEPENTQAKQLLKYIDSHLRKDGLTGMAIVGGTAIVGGLAAVAIGGIFLATGVGMALAKASKTLISRK